MDVDTLWKAETTEEKKKHRDEGCCFECSKQGHMAQNCPTKKFNPRMTQKPSYIKMVQNQEYDDNEPKEYEEGEEEEKESKEQDEIDNLVSRMVSFSGQKEGPMDKHDARQRSGFFSSLNDTAIIWAVFLNNMFQPNIRAVHTKIILHLWNKRADTQALVDSRATESFIHHQIIKQFNIPTTPLTQPRTARNVDGSLNKSGKITEKVELEIQHQNHTKKLQFFITNLGVDNIILGYPFLAITNLELNWKKGTMKGTMVASMHNAHKWQFFPKYGKLPPWPN